MKPLERSARATYPLSVVLVLVSCHDPLTTPELPPPYAGDPELVTSGDIRFACGTWDPATPTMTWGLFDVYWTRASGGDAPGDRPTPAERRRIADLNGIEVYEFNLPVTRAVLSPRAVPFLDGVYLVRGVPDAKTFMIELRIEFRDSIGVSDVASLLALGGDIERWSSQSPAVTALMPDTTLPFLEEHARIALVDRYMFACPA